MKRSVLLSFVFLCALTTSVWAAPKTYQVTGPVVEMTADTLVVQKGSEKWEIARGSANVPADVKVGSKITVKYSMTADSVMSKDDKATSAPKATAK